MQLYIVSDKRSHNVLRSIYIFMRILQWIWDCKIWTWEVYTGGESEGQFVGYIWDITGHGAVENQLIGPWEMWQ